MSNPTMEAILRTNAKYDGRRLPVVTPLVLGIIKDLRRQVAAQAKVTDEDVSALLNDTDAAIDALSEMVEAAKR